MNPKILLSVSLSACVLNGDQYPKPSELPQEWEVAYTRVLAIQAEPPEILPGETASFDALIGQPSGEESLLVRTWCACPTLDDGVGFGCTLDPDLGNLSSDTPDLDALLASGLIGVQPGWIDPVYQAPEDLLQPLDPLDRLEGLYVVIQLVALEGDELNWEESLLDPGELAVSYKRLIVSEASTPNQNPTLEAFEVEGFSVAKEETVAIDPGQPYELAIRILDDSVETYEFVNSQGVVEERLEEPYVAWYTTGGTLLESVTLHPYTQADWISPKRSGIDGTWYAVVRDRRGGMAWWSQRWKTR